MPRPKKRDRSEFESNDEFQDGDRSNHFGIAETLAHLKDQSLRPQTEPPLASKGISHQNGDDWEVVRRKSKKSKRTPVDERDNYPAITHSPHARLQTQVRLSDLQALILYLLSDGPSPQWISIRSHQAIRKVVVVMVPGLEHDMFRNSLLAGSVDSAVVEKFCPSNNSDRHDAPMRKPISPDDYYPQPLVTEDLAPPLRPMAGMFKHIWPVKTPGDDKMNRMHSPLQAILTVPLPKRQEETQMHGPRPPREGRNWEDNPTAIAEFLANVDQLRDFEYTLHPTSVDSKMEKDAELQRRLEYHRTAEDGWVDSIVPITMDCKVPAENTKTTSTLGGRSAVAVDCEMCMTGTETFELTRVSLVNWDGSLLMDELVKPAKPITNYVTPFSGITKEMLDSVTTTIADIQNRLLEILKPDTILIGHSLNSDLDALKLTHHSIVDTSMIYPHPRGPPFKSSLKWLAQKYLSRDIQNGSNGHDSIEDARAALDLVKLKCQRGSKWGTPDASGESIFARLSRSQKPQGLSGNCTGAVVDWGSPKRGYGGASDVCIGCSSDADVVAGIKRAVLGDRDGKVVPGGGVEFTWARMRELETFRRWNGNPKLTDDKPTDSATDQIPDKRDDVVVDGNEAIVDVKATSSPTNGLEETVNRTVTHIKEIYDILPPCTAFVVYSGSGDPRELTRLSSLQQQFKKEYAVKKWDQLSVHWTNVEEQAMKAACRRAREGLGFVTVK